MVNGLKRIILVELPWGRDKDPRVPLGHASLLASLSTIPKCQYYSIVHPINDSDFDVSDVFNKIQNIRNEYVDDEIDIAIGVYVWAEEAIQQLLSRLRQSEFFGRIILGGPQISYSGAGLELLYPDANVFIRGYGESAINALVEYNDRPDMQGIHYAGEPDLCQQTMVDIDLLPSPWLNGVIQVKNQHFIRWESQRGCPFKCGFCQHREPGARLAKREFSKSRIMKEIDLFCENGVRDIAVLDPIFNSSPLSTMILKRFADNRYDGKLSLQCRAEMMDEEFIKAASLLDVCFELGIQTIHPNEGRAVNRNNNMKAVERTINRLNVKKFDYEVSIIFGLPEQTMHSFCETVEWCLSRSVPILKAFPLMLLRGTNVEQRKDEWGLVKSEGSMPVVIKSKTITHEEWCQMERISGALKQTEGEHPGSIRELIDLASGLDIDMSKYRPEISVKRSSDLRGSSNEAGYYEDGNDTKLVFVKDGHHSKSVDSTITTQSYLSQR